MTTINDAFRTYFVLSGEGELGSWDVVTTTEDGIKRRLQEERCGGDRWARAFTDAYEIAEGGFAATEIESGETRGIPTHVVKQSGLIC